MNLRWAFLAIIVAVFGTFGPTFFTACAQQALQRHYVANTRPPDAFLALRTHPSASIGQRVAAMPNGTLLDVFNQQADGWWYVRIAASGLEGWALSGSRTVQWIVCCEPMETKAALPEPRGFKSPSGNIECALEDMSAPGQMPSFSLRCDIRQRDTRPPPKPRSCDGDWGQSFGIGPDDISGRMICVSDAIVHERHPVLEYGSVWQAEGFTCRSEQTGVTCFNARMHGFTLSRGTQRLF